MKKLFLISSFAVFMLAASYSFASTSAVIESTPIAQDDDTKAKEAETTKAGECEAKKTDKECEAKKAECPKDCTASCCKKKEEAK